MGKNTIASRQSKIQYLDLKCKRYTQYLGGYRLLFVNYMEYIAHKSERYTTLCFMQKKSQTHILAHLVFANALCHR